MLKNGFRITQRRTSRKSGENFNNFGFRRYYNREHQHRVHRIVYEQLVKILQNKRFGASKTFFGIKFPHEESGGVTMSQNGYVINLLKRFNMENFNSVRTSMDVNVKLPMPDENDSGFMRDHQSQNLIGALM